MPCPYPCPSPPPWPCPCPCPCPSRHRRARPGRLRALVGEPLRAHLAARRARRLLCQARAARGALALRPARLGRGSGAAVATSAAPPLHLRCTSAVPPPPPTAPASASPLHPRCSSPNLRRASLRWARCSALWSRPPRRTCPASPTSSSDSRRWRSSPRSRTRAAPPRRCTGYAEEPLAPRTGRAHLFLRFSRAGPHLGTAAATARQGEQGRQRRRQEGVQGDDVRALPVRAERCGAPVGR